MTHTASPYSAPQGLVSTEDAARYLGLSPRTLNNWRVDGKGPQFVRLGRSVRYDVRTLEAWISGRTFDSTSAADHHSTTKRAA